MMGCLLRAALPWAAAAAWLCGAVEARARGARRDVARERAAALARHETLDVDERLVYWRASGLNCTRRPAGEKKYITFEVDSGGWNNVRMGVETVYALACLTGRTLVLPPRERVYLLSRGGVDLGKWLAFSPEVEVIAMADFLRRAGERLGCRPEPEASPELWAALRGAGHWPGWLPTKHCLVVAAEAKDGDRRAFCGGRTPVFLGSSDAPWLLHFPLLCCCPAPHAGDCHWSSRWRRLAGAPADAFMFGLPPAVVRDGVRYAEPIFRAASAIVRRLPAAFSSLHVRRGDFEHAVANASFADAAGAARVLRGGEALYVATDDEDGAFLSEFRARGHATKTRRDFLDLLDATEGLDEDMHGPVEQVVAAMGRAFVGSQGSTFSNFVSRLRGYRGADDDSFAFLERGGVGAAASASWPSDPYWFTAWALAWDGRTTRPEDPEAAAKRAAADRARADCRDEGSGFDLPRLRCQADPEDDAPGPAPPAPRGCAPPARFVSQPRPPPFVGYDFTGDECTCMYARGLSACPARRTGRPKDRPKFAAENCGNFLA